MPPQHASETSEARLPRLGARAASPRPHLVTSGHWSREADGAGVTSTDYSAEFGRAARGELSVVHLRQRPDGLSARSFKSDAWLHATGKRILDIVGALVLGVVFSPLILGIALLLRYEGGPVIYRHRRVGRDGKIFECLKFRSMVPNAERALRDLLEEHAELRAEWVRDHKLRYDPRVTRLGRFLRRTSLDELPQVWNVMRGEMSLVGPRPVVREELMRYGRCLSTYLSVKPGITGLWQVTGRNDTDYRRRVALDVYYVRRKSLMLDLYILVKTPPVVLGGGGAY